MSNPHITPHTGEPSESRLFLSVIGWIGVILIFVLILWLAYVPYRPAPVDQAAIDRRYTIKDRVVAEQRNAINTYGWQDQTAGVVRIPIERAMEITIQRLQNEGMRNTGARAAASNAASASQ